MTLQLRALCCAFGLLLVSPVFAAPQVRIGYVIASDRTAEPGADITIQNLALSIQDWYADQLDRFGFGRRTFDLELDPGTGRPVVHQVNANQTAATMRTDLWAQTIGAAGAGGLTPWTPGEVWLLVAEAHAMQPNGVIDGNVALGGGFGSGDGAGVALVGSDYLFRADPARLLIDTPYDGVTVGVVGPHPLVQGVSFGNAEGTTFSSIASAAQGATAHELGHAFGLGHDVRNDENGDGLLMGNGLRGWRGSIHPDLYPDDTTQLGYGAALALSTSRYFNADQPTTDTTSPSVTVLTSGAVGTTDGMLKIDFTASDSGSLSAVLLQRNSELIGEMTLDGRSATASISTPYFRPGVADNYKLLVYDESGNRRDQEVSITVASGADRAPEPFIDAGRDRVWHGEYMLLDASRSNDADGDENQMIVEWDLDGDGVFDTRPSTTKKYFARFPTPGNFLVSARLTDADGYVSVSAPISVVVESLPGDYNLDDVVDAADYTLWRDQLGQTGAGLAADGDGNLVVDALDYQLWRDTFGLAMADAALPTPEPAAGAVLLLAAGLAPQRRR